jgi:lysophospholipase
MDWLQPDGTLARGSLLFAGGRGDFIEKYLEAHSHWHRRGWNVTAFDWRGQGGSRGTMIGGHLDSLDVLVDDLAALVDAWKMVAPAPHVAVGHSMGGHVLLRLLAEHAPRLDASVLVAPMLMINSSPLPPWTVKWMASLFSLLGWRRRPAWRASATPARSRRQSNLTGCRERYEDELWWWQREPGFNLGAPSWGWLRAAYGSAVRLRPSALARVQSPVLLIGAERDRLVSIAAIRAAAGRIPGAQLLILEDSAHEILRERDEVRLKALARIDAFLDQHAPR